MYQVDDPLSTVSNGIQLFTHCLILTVIRRHVVCLPDLLNSVLRYHFTEEGDARKREREGGR